MDLPISTNLFGTTFYSLVGLHATHVIIGLTLLVLVFILSLRGYLTIMHRERLEMLSWYWHFVDAVWVVVFHGRLRHWTLSPVIWSKAMMPEQKSEHTSGRIEVPAPTFWPFVTAFGIALMLAGLVTKLLLSVS